MRNLLFKYVSPDRIDVLRHARIRFTPYKHLNDPYDSAPFVKGFATPTAAQWLIGKLVGGVRLADQDVAKPLREVLTPGEIDRLQAHLMGVAARIMASPAAFSPKLRPELQKAIAPLQESFGMLSLTEDPASVLMWTHYAANHAGLVLGFDKRHEFFAEQRRERLITSTTEPVRYTTRRPRVNLSSKMYRRKRDRANHFRAIFFRKSRAWQYEREWRVVRLLEDANHVLSVDGEPIHLFEFAPEMLNTVTLGCRTDPKVREEVREIISETRYSHVVLREVELLDNSYRLNVTTVE